MNKKIIVLFAVLFFGQNVYQSWADSHPNLAATNYVNQGKKEFKAKNYDDAIVDFNKALLADPDNEEALMYLKMMGFGGQETKVREQDPVQSEKTPDNSKAKTKSKKSKKELAKKSDLEKKTVKKSEKKFEKKSVKSSAKKDRDTIQGSPVSVAEEVQEVSEAPEVEDIAQEDLILQEIETQIEQDEAAALKVVREEAEKEEEVILKKAQAKKKKTHPAQKVTKSKDNIKKSPVVKSQQAKQKSSESAVLAEEERIESVSSEAAVAKDHIAGEVFSTEERGTYQDPDLSRIISEMDHDDIKSEEMTALEQPRVKPTKKTAQKSAEKKVVEKKAAAKKLTQDMSRDMGDVAHEFEAAADRETEIINDIKNDTVEKEQRVQRSIQRETAAKIEKIHKQYESRPIGKNEKTIVRDVDDDGIPEEISLKENRVIEKVEAQALKEEQVVVKKIRQQATKDEKVALKKLRADIKKEQKLGAKNKKNLDADIGPIDEVSLADEVVDEDEVEDISEDEEAVLAEVRENLEQKEKDIALKYAKKKAMRISEAEQKLKPQVQEEKISLSESASQDDSVESVSSEQVVEPSFSEEKPRSLQAKNTVLKKKLVQIIDMSQKDQELIRDLENNVQVQDKKVESLEADLNAAQISIDSKVALLNEKEEKLKDLTVRIAAMEADVNSKQYDFKDKQIEYEKKLQAIEKEFGNYKAERANTEEELREQLRILKEALEKKIAELNAVQEKLIFTENKLQVSESKFLATAKQYDEVKKTLSDLEDRLSKLGSEPLLSDDQIPLVEINPKNLPPPKSQNEVVYQQWIKRQDALVTKLKDKLLWAREQMEFLGRYDIKLTDQKMALLKEQLATVKRQLSAQVPTGRTEEDFALMEARFKDSQERLDTVEKILREKDEQVQELEKQLNEVLSGF